MPEIYLADFVDFVIRAGTPKLTKVREIKTRPDYSPAVDFWKTLREALVEFHKNGKSFDNLAGTIADPKKIRRYPDAIRAYKKFSKNKQTTWFEPPSAVWNAPDLRVKVNPELGLQYNGQDFIAKLYFKAEVLSQRRLAVVLQMMKASLGAKAGLSGVMAVLDVNKSRMLPVDPNAPDITPLLIGEAASFVAMWNAL
jgi:hypothetical protein